MSVERRGGLARRLVGTSFWMGAEVLRFSKGPGGHGRVGWRVGGEGDCPRVLGHHQGGRGWFWRRSLRGGCTGDHGSWRGAEKRCDDDDVVFMNLVVELWLG